MAAFISRKINNKMTLLKSSWDLSGSSSVPNLPLLVLFMPFLGSKPRHHQQYLKTYENFYRPLKRPLEMLVVQANILDFLITSRGKLLSSNIIDVMQKDLNPSSKLIVHGMSIGNHTHALNLKYSKDTAYKDKIVGQIFDSPVYGGPIKSGGIEKIVEGMIETVMAKNRLESDLIRRVLLSIAYFAVNRKSKVFDEDISHFVSKSAKKNTLTFSCKNDIMIDSSKWNDVVNDWKEQGTDVDNICFNDSIHAKHIMQHPKVFETHFSQFLAKLPL